MPEGKSRPGPARSYLLSLKQCSVQTRVIHAVGVRCESFCLFLFIYTHLFIKLLSYLSWVFFIPGCNTEQTSKHLHVSLSRGRLGNKWLASVCVLKVSLLLASANRRASMFNSVLFDRTTSVRFAMCIQFSSHLRGDRHKP